MDKKNKEAYTAEVAKYSNGARIKAFKSEIGKEVVVIEKDLMEKLIAEDQLKLYYNENINRIFLKSIDPSGVEESIKEVTDVLGFKFDAIQREIFTAGFLKGRKNTLDFIKDGENKERTQG